MIEALEILLVDDFAIQILSVVLGSFPAWDPCWGPPPAWIEPEVMLSTDHEQAVFDRQWLLLPDEVIAGLLLSPTTLRRLQNKICDEFPLAWLDQIDAGSDRILERYSSFLREEE